MSGFVLALDQGTTNTKALAIDAQGRIAARHSVPTPVALSQAGLGRAVGRGNLERDGRGDRGLPRRAAGRRAPCGDQRSPISASWCCCGAGRPARRSARASLGSAGARPTGSTQFAAPEVEETVVAKTGLGLDPLLPRGEDRLAARRLSAGRARWRRPATFAPAQSILGCCSI